MKVGGYTIGCSLTNKLRGLPPREQRFLYPCWFCQTASLGNYWGSYTSHPVSIVVLQFRRKQAEPLWGGGSGLGSLSHWNSLCCECDGGHAAAQPSCGSAGELMVEAMMVVATVLHWAMTEDPGGREGWVYLMRSIKPSPVNRTFGISQHSQGSGKTVVRFDSFYSSFCWDVSSSS